MGNGSTHCVSRKISIFTANPATAVPACHLRRLHPGLPGFDGNNAHHIRLPRTSPRSKYGTQSAQLA
jgi:hypothetical protein